MASNTNLTLYRGRLFEGGCLLDHLRYAQLTKRLLALMYKVMLLSSALSRLLLVADQHAVFEPKLKAR